MENGKSKTEQRTAVAPNAMPETAAAGPNGPHSSRSAPMNIHLPVMAFDTVVINRMAGPGVSPVIMARFFVQMPECPVEVARLQGFEAHWKSIIDMIAQQTNYYPVPPDGPPAQGVEPISKEAGEPVPLATGNKKKKKKKKK